MTTRPRISILTTLALIALTSSSAFAQHNYQDDYRGDSSSWQRSYNNDGRLLPASWSHDYTNDRDDRDYDRREFRFNRTDSNCDRCRTGNDPRNRFQETSYRRYRGGEMRITDPVRDHNTGALDEYLKLRLGKQNPDRLYHDDYRLRDDYGLINQPPYRRIDDRRYWDRSDRPVRGYDPLTPPLPRRDGGDDAAALLERLSTRYQNPATVRTVRSLSTNQAVQLYREVSTQTDGRHLEPTSYDLRVRRALRNLGLALENPVATRALGISADSFRVDGFRDALARIWDGMNINSRSDAESVMQTVMQHAQQVPGMTPGMVAYEFANATVDTLDKFSALEPAGPTQGPSAALESEMVGIGVEVKLHDDGLLLVRALRGGPAAEAGLKAGDIVTAIDRKSIAGMAMAQSVDLIKGHNGSRISLQIARNGRNTGTITLTRRRFRVWTVNDVRMISGTDVGYINLSQFAQSSTQEVDQALQQLHRKGMKSLVLDLRGNPGGLLNVCVDITNRFLPSGTIVSTKGRLNDDNMHEAATFNRTWDIPLVVLIDGDSASASEILAAAVQDNNRGVVVGQKSYGKGTVQTHFPLQSINGNLRLTTARFYSPSGRAMSGSGVTPDVLITDADGVANGDRVMSEAMQVAQSRQLKDMAVASGRNHTNQNLQQRRSFNGAMFDAVQPRTVLR